MSGRGPGCLASGVLTLVVLPEPKLGSCPWAGAGWTDPLGTVEAVPRAHECRGVVLRDASEELGSPGGGAGRGRGGHKGTTRTPRGPYPESMTRRCCPQHSVSSVPRSMGDGESHAVLSSLGHRVIPWPAAKGPSGRSRWAAMVERGSNTNRNIRTPVTTRPSQGSVLECPQATRQPLGAVGRMMCDYPVLRKISGGVGSGRGYRAQPVALV